MAERKTKGFLTDQGEGEVFTVKEEVKAKVTPEESLLLEIGVEKSLSTPDKIYLAKQRTYSHLTGIAWKDVFIRLNDYFIEHSKIKIKDISTTFRLLSVMINAGLPLIKSLNTLGVQSNKVPRLARILFDLATKIEAGKSFSSAMAEYPDVFSEGQIGAISAGEASGQLNKALRAQAEELEKVSSIQGKVKGALIYPVSIIIVMVVVVAIVMIFVVPQISGLYSGAGKQLPAPTRILMAMSDFLISYWHIMLGSIIAVVVAVKSWKKTKSGRYNWDLMMTKIPLFGELVKKSAISKFAHSFGNLLGAGVPIIKAMEIVANGIGNEVYKKRFLLAAEDMKSGIPMAESMSNSNLFPSLLVNMIEVGEQTAQLEHVTQKVADFYDEEVDNAVNAVTKAMEPMVIVLVGAVVGGLVAAIMLPITQLSSLVE